MLEGSIDRKINKNNKETKKNKGRGKLIPTYLFISFLIILKNYYNFVY